MVSLASMTERNNSPDYDLSTSMNFEWLMHRPLQRYFALSYVWGEAQGKCLNATKSNIAALREAGSLPAEPLGASLSFSIEDAVRVCWKFEEQYLWVDSLCVIQDDPEDKRNRSVLWRKSIQLRF
jgi:hypothetical protein